MNNDKTWLRCTILLLGAGLLSGCATSRTIPFTHELRYSYQLSNEDLSNLQYYLAETITLNRSDAAVASGIASGKLVTQGQSVIDEIVVNEGTPGIVTSAGDDWITVSFEKNSSTLPFSLNEAYGGPWSGLYTLSGRTWNNGIGAVEYDGKVYNAIRNSGLAYLVIDKRSLYRVVRNRRALSGRLLSESR